MLFGSLMQDKKADEKTLCRQRLGERREWERSGGEQVLGVLCPVSCFLVGLGLCGFGGFGVWRINCMVVIWEGHECVG